MMKRFFPFTFVALLVYSCTEIVPEAADGPLGPAVQMSASSADAEIAPELSVSTTCQSFRRELDEVNEQLAASPDAMELQQKQVALGSIVADVCN
jgi:hypothetical protein